MNFFSDIYNLLVYRPLLNILQGFYNITGDIGISIIILGLVVNLLMWPLFAQAYINGQKTKVLQPLLTDIRTKYKDDPQEMLRQRGAFNKKHGIRNNSVFLVLIFQLLFASGLWSLTRRISDSQLVDGEVQIPGLYVDIFGREITNFNKIAFGFLNIGDNAREQLWLPIIAAFLSFLYGYYTFRLAPKPKVLPKKVPKSVTKKSKKGAKAEDTKEPVKAFDPEAFQKSMEIQTIYIIPAFMLFLNLSLTVGVNLYFAAVSLLSLVRQIILTNYYASHTDKLFDEITKSDPSLMDDDPTNNLEITAPGDVTSMEPIPMVVIADTKAKKSATVAKTSKKSKKSSQVAKKASKNTKKGSKK
jgi:YidC/Oxa1 family membrane protein insertase